jgi:hypothetical protein
MDRDITDRPSAMPDQVAQVRMIIKLHDDQIAIRMARKALADRKARAALDGEAFEADDIVLSAATESGTAPLSELAKQALPPSSEGESNT